MDDPFEGVDLVHLAACVDPHCLYCNDEQPAKRMDEDERGFLDALVSRPLAA